METKSKIVQMREDSERLEFLAAELQAEDKERTRLMSAAVGVLLASEDFICEDLRVQLIDAKSYLAGSFPETEGVAAAEPESKADAAIEETITTPKGIDGATVVSLVKDIEELLDHTTAEGQKEVLAILQNGQPQRTADYEAEEAMDEARDNLINSLNELPRDVQMKFYRMFHVTVVDEGKEIAA